MVGGQMLNMLAKVAPTATPEQVGKDAARRFPEPLERAARRADETARGLLTGGTLFEELGFYYVGPVDGHDMDHLVPILRNLRDADDTHPFLLHVVTQKGKGYPPAEASADKYHGVQKFNVVTGEQAKAASGPPSYTKVFAKALIAEAEHDVPRVQYDKAGLNAPQIVQVVLATLGQSGVAQPARAG